MKIQKVLSMMIIFALLFSACEKDKINEGKEDPIENDNTDDCMEFSALDDSYRLYRYVQFINDNEAWLVAGRKDEVSANYLLKTEDAGETWNLINSDLQIISNNHVINGEAVRFINSTDGFAITNYTCYEGKLNLAYTTDKGATWQEIPDITTQFTSYSWQKTIAFNSTHTLFLGKDVDYKHLLVLFVDNTTKTVSNFYEYDTFSNLGDNAFMTKLTGLHLSENGTITTVIGGEDNSGEQCRIAQSSDNGVTWTIRATMDFPSVETADWVADNFAYINGKKNSYRTTDAGVSWTKFETPDFRCLSFADASNGIGLTDFDFYTTTDGGATWTQLDCGTYNGIGDYLSYPSVNNGWILGSKTFVENNEIVDKKYGFYKYKGE